MYVCYTQNPSLQAVIHTENLIEYFVNNTQWFKELNCDPIGYKSEISKAFLHHYYIKLHQNAIDQTTITIIMIIMIIFITTNIHHLHHMMHKNF